MMKHRIAGILRQYGPEVAFFSTEVLLGHGRRGRYGLPMSYYLCPPDSTGTGMDRLNRDLAGIGDVPLIVLIMQCIDQGKWYEDTRIDVNVGTEILAPWVARLVNQWFKTMPMTHEELVEHYKALANLTSNVRDIADWARETRPDLMRLTVNQVLHRSRRWHAQFKREQAAKEAPPSDVVFTFGPWSVHALTTREALRHEGQSQHHCVGGYWDRVQRGETMIFSVRDEKGVSKATLEVQDDQLVQMRGPANREVKKSDLLQVISDFLGYMGFSAGYHDLPEPEVQEAAMRANPWGGEYATELDEGPEPIWYVPEPGEVLLYVDPSNPVAGLQVMVIDAKDSGALVQSQEDMSEFYVALDDLFPCPLHNPEDIRPLDDNAPGEEQAWRWLERDAGKRKIRGTSLHPVRADFGPQARKVVRYLGWFDQDGELLGLLYTHGRQRYIRMLPWPSEHIVEARPETPEETSEVYAERERAAQAERDWRERRRQEILASGRPSLLARK